MQGPFIHSPFMHSCNISCFVIIHIAKWGKARPDSFSQFCSMSTLYILCEIVHIVFALPKRDVEPNLSWRCRLQPELHKFQYHKSTCIYKVNYFSTVNRIARQSIRLSMLDFVGRIFFPVVHGILLSHCVISLDQTTRGRI